MGSEAVQIFNAYLDLMNLNEFLNKCVQDENLNSAHCLKHIFIEHSSQIHLTYLLKAVLAF